MSSIDTRVVEAKFDNNQFLAGVKSTLNSLTQLNKGLQLEGATNSLSNISDGVDKISSRFAIMKSVAYTALNTITRQGVYAAEHIVAAFTIAPISAGFKNYETQINAIQTILANTGLKGASGMAKVNKVLAQLNVYANLTVYNFSEMAKNIGTFTAAGVKLNVAANAIKGIANLAALSGANSDQASSAMYQLSQAIAANQVKLQDWNSVVNAGLGGKVFQNALFTTAEALHTIKGVTIGETFDQWTKAGNSFRQSLQSGWITGKVLTQTLAGFTGDLTIAQLKAEGYTAAQAKQIHSMGATAVDAATKIKTLSQLTDALKEEVATAYAAIFKTLFGNITQAKAMFSQLHQFLENGLTNPLYAFNKVLQSWVKHGGKVALIETIKDGFKDIESFIEPIKAAFKEIFPAESGKELANISKGIRDFVASLKIGADTADNLKRTFAGFFAFLDIGWQVVKAGAKFIADLFGAITKGEGSGGFLGATASIGDFLVAIDNAIKKGHGLTDFFNGLEKILEGPIRIIKSIADAIFGLFSFKAPSSGNITTAFKPFATLGSTVSLVWKDVIGILGRVFHAFTPISQAFDKFFKSLSSNLKSGLSLNSGDILKTFDTGLLAGLVLLVHKITKLFHAGLEAPNGILETLTEPFEEVTKTLRQMQSSLRAATLLQIATAIGIMTVSVIGLSKVNAGDLTRALTAMGGMFAQLFAGLLALEHIGGVENLIRTATGLILFATAIRILTSSVKSLSKLNWEQLGKGLANTAGLVAALVLASNGMSLESGGMIRAGAGLTILAAGVRVLAISVKTLATLDWKQLAKGLTGVGGLLVGLTLFTKFSETNAGGIAQGAGLILLGTAIDLLAKSVKKFAALDISGLGKGLGSISAVLAVLAVFSKTVGNPVSLVASGASLILIAHAMTTLSKAFNSFAGMSWEQISKGLVTLAGALTIISIALIAMDGGIVGAAAIIVVAGAFKILAPALLAFAHLSWEQMAKGLITLAGALAIIAVALIAMDGGIVGAVAIVAVAAAFEVLAPALLAFAHLSWEEIAKGLVTLAGALTIIGVAGLVLTPVVIPLLGLGAAIVLLGVGMLAAGAGILAFATGLTALSVAGGALVTSVVAIVSGLLGLVPTIAKELALALTAMAVGIEAAGPAIVKAIAAVLLSLIKAVQQDGPPLIELFGDLLVKVAAVMAKDAPKITDSFLKMLTGMFDAVKKNADPIVNAFTNMIVALLSAATKRVPDFVDAAVKLMVKFLNGIASKVDDLVDAGTNIVIALIKGIGKNATRIDNAALDTIVDFINGLAKAITSHIGAFRDAGKNIAFAIADGMTLGLARKVKDVAGAAENLAKSALGSAKHFLGIASPSKEFYKLGQFVDQGFANGILDGKETVQAAWSGVHDLLKSAMQSTEQDIQDNKTKLKDLTKAYQDAPKAIAAATKSVEAHKAKLAELTAEYGKNSNQVKAAEVELDDAKNHLDKLTTGFHDYSSEIDKTTAALARAEKEHELTKNAFDELTNGLDNQKTKLKDLGSQYDELKTKIQNATQALQDAKQARDDYDSSITDEFNTLPDITGDTQLTDYITDLQGQVADVQTFSQDIAQLKALGLSDAMYKQLLASGVDALPFVQQILAGGQASVDELNSLDSQLATEAQALGSTASINLYQAGVDAATGLLNGLKSQRKAIEKEIKEIGDEIEAILKKKLEIQSPSKVLSRVGVNTLQGLLQGIQKTRPSVEKAVSSIGQYLVDTFERHANDASDLFSDLINPVISPVLDLTSFNKDAATIQNSLGVAALSVDTSLTGATTAIAQAQAAKDANDNKTPDAVMTPTTITFTQNNNSPKALSAAEIYRNTKNQISVAKGVLDKNDA